MNATATEMQPERSTPQRTAGRLFAPHGALLRRYSQGADPNRRNYRQLFGTRHVLLARMRSGVYYFLEDWGGEILNMGIPRELKPDIE